MRSSLVTFVIVILGCLALRGDGAAQVSPPPMAQELAGGAVVALEVEDLGAGLRRWRDSSLRTALDRTAALAEMQRSRIFRKLTARVARLDEILGFELTLDRLILAAGRRAALGLYDVSDTRFVVVADTSPLPPPPSPLWGARGRMERREHAGVPYYLAPATARRSGAALALVGNRLVFGTDEKAFRATLVLAARAAGVPVRAAPGPALADDPKYQRLRAAAPRDLFARVFVDQGLLSGTPQFDKRWIFDLETAARVDAALLGVRFERDETVETRVYAFAAGQAAPPLAPLPPGQVFGRAPLARAVPAVPGAPYAARHPTTAAAAARALAALCDSADGTDVARLQALLTRAAPVVMLEAADPPPRAGLRAHDRSGVTLLLARPGELDQAALEAALVAGRLRGLEIAGGPKAAFANEAGARVLRLPLMEEFVLTVRRDQPVGATLTVATDPELAGRLHAVALGGAPTTAALHLDLRRAGAYLGDVTALLGARTNWSTADARFYARSVAGLPAAWRAVRDLAVVEFSHGGLQLVEAHYREGTAAP